LPAAGAEPNKSGKYGLIPLNRAAYFGRLDIVNALLAAGADPNLSDKNGITPLLRSLKLLAEII
jgi:ankyrin repeat protein